MRAALTLPAARVPSLSRKRSRAFWRPSTHCNLALPLFIFYPYPLRIRGKPSALRIFRHSNELPADLRGGVVALGNFDGVHRGHQQVIGMAKAIGRERRLPVGVMTFEPHPKLLFRPDLPPFRLSPFRIKARHIEAMGVDYLYAQHFDRDFASHTAEDFVDLVLVNNLGARHVVIGYDYVFGKGREGNCELLQTLARQYGFGVTAVEAVRSDSGTVYSSTNVRACLTSGDMAGAARILGYYWEIEGRVEHGDARGRTIGFPTANLTLGEYLHPATGVYACRAGIDQGGETIWHDAVANFGKRPTFDKTDVLLEVHLFDFQGDLYGRHLRVALVEHLRPERKFDGLDALQAQITQDCARAREVLAAHRFSSAPGPLVPSEEQ